MCNCVTNATSRTHFYLIRGNQPKESICGAGTKCSCSRLQTLEKSKAVSFVDNSLHIIYIYHQLGILYNFPSDL